jgi:hypothetical protein
MPRSLRSPRSSIGALTCLLVQIGCTPPGEGEKALAGFRSSAGIIQALGEFQAKHGAYPAKLELLVPEIATPALLQLPSGVARYEYRLDGAGFELQFNYTGPGTNDCVFASAKRSWKCYGAF